MSDPIVISNITDTVPVDASGRVLVTITGQWNGASALFQRLGPKETGPGATVGGPYWTSPPRPVHPDNTMPPNRETLVPECRQPFTADETRVMYLVPGRLRITRAYGGRAPLLTLTIGDASAVPVPPLPPEYRHSPSYRPEEVDARMTAAFTYSKTHTRRGHEKSS